MLFGFLGAKKRALSGSHRCWIRDEADCITQTNNEVNEMKFLKRIKSKFFQNYRAHQARSRYAAMRRVEPIPTELWFRYPFLIGKIERDRNWPKF